MPPRPRILVVEDSAVIWRLIRATCDELGELSWEPDGVAGLDAIRRDIPDLVVLDIGLPHLDGWGVLSAVRSDPAVAHVSVLVLTAHADSASRERARSGGANAFMTKPFRPADLRSTLVVLLSRVSPSR
jgi:CheY-like chemotaxis protein